METRGIFHLCCRAGRIEPPARCLGALLLVYGLSELGDLGRRELGSFACLFRLLDAALLDAALIGVALTGDPFNRCGSHAVGFSSSGGCPTESTRITARLHPSRLRHPTAA